MEAKIVCTCADSYNAYMSHWNKVSFDFSYLADITKQDFNISGIKYNKQLIRDTFNFTGEVSKAHYWNSFGNRDIIWFYAHLRMLYYYHFNREFDYYWFFYDDVTIDNWDVFFNSFKNNDADFFSYYVFKNTDTETQNKIPCIDKNTTSQHMWFERFPGDGDKLPDYVTEKFGSFFPIVRLSNPALKLLHELLFDGIYGYSEGFVPTILNYPGFKLDTIFDNTSKSKYFDDDIVNVKHKHSKIHWSWI